MGPINISLRDQAIPWALVLWLFQGISMVFLICWNPNNYTTIDSGYYLSSAQNLLWGNGYVIYEQGRFVWNGHFPPGYSIVIAIISGISNISVLWSSKLVNWLASGGLLYFIAHKYSTKTAVSTGFFLCSGLALKLWVHTWSEPMFLCVLFIWCHYYLNDAKNNFLVLAVLTILLILTRYAGMFIIPMLVVNVIKGKNREISTYLLLISSLVFVGILSLNFVFSSELYGGNRFTEITPFDDNVKIFARGLLNELLIFRDIGSKGLDVLSALGIVLQMIGMAIIWRLGNFKRDYILNDWAVAYPYFRISLYYLFFLFLLRLISPFDAPGYRLLAPFTYMVLTGILLISEKKDDPYKVYAWIVFVVISWINLLPS